MKLLGAFAAGLIALTAVSATPAAAQPRHGHGWHDDHGRWHNGHRAHHQRQRVCRTSWHHHHRVRNCWWR